MICTYAKILKHMYSHTSISIGIWRNILKGFSFEHIFLIVFAAMGVYAIVRKNKCNCFLFFAIFVVGQFGCITL